SPAYWAPEAFRGHIGEQSDQYGLAITYVELRTGRRPFPTRASLYESMVDALEGVPDLSDLHDREREVIQRSLAKNLEGRYPNCLAWVEALEAACGTRLDQAARETEQPAHETPVQQGTSTTSQEGQQRPAANIEPIASAMPPAAVDLGPTLPYTPEP